MILLKGSNRPLLLDFGAASATSMILLAAALALFALYDRFFGIDRMWR